MDTRAAGAKAAVNEMTKSVDLQNLLDDFAAELTDRELKELERDFEEETVIGYLRKARE